MLAGASDLARRRGVKHLFVLGASPGSSSERARCLGACPRRSRGITPPTPEKSPHRVLASRQHGRGGNTATSKTSRRTVYVGQYNGHVQFVLKNEKYYILPRSLWSGPHKSNRFEVCITCNLLQARPEAARAVRCAGAGCVHSDSAGLGRRHWPKYGGSKRPPECFGGGDGLEGSARGALRAPVRSRRGGSWARNWRDGAHLARRWSE
jgi:hypothetical protein